MAKSRRQSNETVDASIAALAARPALLATLPTTSGTAIDFTAIPAGAKRITLVLNGVSTNSTAPFIVQLGTAANLVTSGYTSFFTFLTGTGTGGNTATNGFGFWNGAAVDIHYVTVTLLNLGNGVWSYSVSGGFAGGGGAAHGSVAGGVVSLGADLTRLRLTTTTGTPLFDAGSLVVFSE